MPLLRITYRVRLAALLLVAVLAPLVGSLASSRADEEISSLLDAGTPVSSADATEQGEVEENIAGLYDTLSKGLMARRPSEFQFIRKVVTYVDMDKLTRKMVLETFHWARRKVGIIHRR